MYLCGISVGTGSLVVRASVRYAECRSIFSGVFVVRESIDLVKFDVKLWVGWLFPFSY